jgi:hypothetical protein
MAIKHTAAFPWSVDDGERIKGEKGMTLRDYFAAKAVQGLISTEGAGSAERYAEISYKLADAMLKARDE